MKLFFFFNDTATTEIYTLSLHDALPIFMQLSHVLIGTIVWWLESEKSYTPRQMATWFYRLDRKSTRLNSSHMSISYAVFCLKKKILRDRIVGIRAVRGIKGNSLRMCSLS